MADEFDPDDPAFVARLEAAIDREKATKGGTAVHGELDDHVRGSRVIWRPHPGSQENFLCCPVFELLVHGSRGGGKTDALLMSFAVHVGRGHGAAWRGILFRQSYPQLADVVAKSQKWFTSIFPGARFNRTKMYWEFPDGEMLLFRHIDDPSDYWNYHGHEYPWIGFEELTNWPSSECYTRMFSCCRSSSPGVPKMIRSTTNPAGPGHNWVADRFRLRGGAWRHLVLIDDDVDADGRVLPARAAMPSDLSENLTLTEADPDYLQKIASAADNPAVAEAWTTGSWDVVAGGMFDDVWSFEHNVVEPFEIPWSWRIDRAFDWGSSKPFSVGWYATSDGSDVRLSDGRVMSTVRGDLFRVREWYGWNRKPDHGLKMLAKDVAEGIVRREIKWGWREGDEIRVKPGPADSQIWVEENGPSIAYDMQRRVRIGKIKHKGVRWTKADKRPGSRVKGWERMRQRMRDAHPPERGVRENPGFFVFKGHNPQFLRTVLSLPRDEIKTDDIAQKTEDHIADEVRYRIAAAGFTYGSGNVRGMF